MSEAAAEDSDLIAAPPELRLDGKVAWITGASRGLGRALAFAFAGAGAELLLTARSAQSLEATADIIRQSGGRAHTSAGSVTDPADVQRAVAVAGDAWGRLDVLVNNAGISPVLDRAEHIDVERFSEIVDVNLTGAFRCCRAALDLLQASEAPSVINISSIHGASALERMIAYSSSKAALEMMSRTLALEWADRGIRVNAVAPGYIETEMTEALRASERLHSALVQRIPLGRFARPREIVGAALFLAGDAARYVTGATFAVDGGWSAR